MASATARIVPIFLISVLVPKGLFFLWTETLASTLRAPSERKQLHMINLPIWLKIELCRWGIICINYLPFYKNMYPILLKLGWVLSLRLPPLPHQTDRVQKQVPSEAVQLGLNLLDSYIWNGIKTHLDTHLINYKNFRDKKWPTCLHHEENVHCPAQAGFDEFVKFSHTAGYHCLPYRQWNLTVPSGPKEIYAELFDNQPGEKKNQDLVGAIQVDNLIQFQGILQEDRNKSNVSGQK